MKLKSKGFTLVEIIVLIAIIAILIVIAVPRLNGYTEKAKKQVCEINCGELDKMYNQYLVIEGIKHEESLFEEYIDQHDKSICPENGVISYKEERVECEIHSENHDEGSGDVPYI